MAPLSAQVLEGNRHVHALAGACQRFVGDSLIVEPGAFLTALRQFASDIPEEHSTRERLFIWNAVSTAAMRGAAEHHQMFHRSFGGACSYLPLWPTAPDSFSAVAIVLR